MDIGFVPLEFLLSTEGWLTAEVLAERFVAPLIGLSLQADGLLTTALQLAYDLPASVECRRQSGWLDGQGQRGLRRDVLIYAGEIPCVAAATLMPQPVLAQHPWLGSLENNPLGEMLEKHAVHQRGPFAFAQLEAELLFPSPTHARASLWARRYRFFLAESSLLVTEIFFPGVLERLGKAM